MSRPLEAGDPGEPEISVVLVTYGAWEWTERCLEALFETTDAAYELICVDNASPDGSADRLASIPGVRLVRSTVNLGYGVAANLAAMRARAPYLLLLNTDAIVQPGWLPPLRSVLDAEDDVAAVAARLLHLDGRLQEAGAVIWGDGMTDCYGDGDDPRRSEYRFRRDVDYASAACLLVRRSAFLDAGGFDPIYQPAYYEDTDLAMRWRSRGLRVVYQPLSTAVHKRWASSGDRSAMEHLVDRHRPVFLERWRALTGDRPPRPVPEDPRALLAVRDAECGTRVLGVVDRLASTTGRTIGEVVPLFGGGWAGCRRSLLCFDDSAESDATASLRALGVEVVGATEVAGWLAGRRHHYTTVLAGADLAAGLVTGLLDTQAFAARVLVVGEGTGDLATSRWAGLAHSALCTGATEAAQVRRLGSGIPVTRLDAPDALRGWETREVHGQ